MALRAACSGILNTRSHTHLRRVQSQVRKTRLLCFACLENFFLLTRSNRCGGQAGLEIYHNDLDYQQWSPIGVVWRHCQWPVLAFVCPRKQNGTFAEEIGYLISLAQNAFVCLPDTVQQPRVGVFAVHSHNFYVLSAKVDRAYIVAAESAAATRPIGFPGPTVTVEMKWDIRSIEERRKMVTDLTCLLHCVLEDGGYAAEGDDFFGIAYEALAPLGSCLANGGTA